MGNLLDVFPIARETGHAAVSLRNLATFLEVLGPPESLQLIEGKDGRQGLRLFWRPQGKLRGRTAWVFIGFGWGPNATQEQILALEWAMQRLGKEGFPPGSPRTWDLDNVGKNP